MKYSNIREEELKNKVSKDFFSNFDTTKIVGDIDFCVSPIVKVKNQGKLFENETLLWAEAKTGNFNIITTFVQLIITIGKARTFDKNIPPAFLGAFDFKKIAFVPYNNIQDIFYQNDFNWNVTPSNHETREFLLVRARVEEILHTYKYEYDYVQDEKELKFFIKNNIAKSTEAGKISIDKNNFVPIYLRWLEQVKPNIDFDWLEGKKQNIFDSDFYLADLFVDDKDTANIDDDSPVKNELFIVFKNGHYEISKENIKQLFNASFHIKDKKVYEQFWKKYKRPPLEKFQYEIVERRDLLVPQDIRERKGAFFTPRPWVELSQKYLAEVLGENWQDEYYIWDCAAGTGNLLAGLTNKYNIWASTLDMADVNAMHDRINNGANLLTDHVFQFDFLNDDFRKLPKRLYDIINDEEKRKKLVIYINPPYAEADNRRGEGRSGVATTEIHKKYSTLMGYSKREIYVQFMTRIYCEIYGCVLANFSTLKNLQAPKFQDFRSFFRAKLEKIFLTPANTFDNVKGNFPIGFFIWNTAMKEDFTSIMTNIYDKNENFIGAKKLWAYDNLKLINDWVKTFRNSSSDSIATLIGVGSDFQNQRLVRFGPPHMKVPADNHNWQVTKDNLIKSSIYYAVRKVIDADWLNDREQFLYPDDNWQLDYDFQNDCLTYTLFNNNLQLKNITNHWIPFSEYEINARDKFDSNFMHDFIKGRIKAEQSIDLFNPANLSHSGENSTELIFSSEAKLVFNAGRELWAYYHKQSNANINANLYDIREHFQGRDNNGKMNNMSENETYRQLIGALRDSLKTLAKKIEPKIYEYGFLKT